MQNKSRLAASYVVSAWLVAACGGGTSDGGAGAACSAFTACGGDVTGTWDVTNVCVDTVPPDVGSLPPECAHLINSLSIQMDGTYVFDADGTATFSGQVTSVSSVRYTDACLHALKLPAGQEAAGCTSIEAGLQKNGTATCGYGSGACSCTLQETQSIDKSGTWAKLDSDTLVDEKGDPADYCVEGATLRIESTSSSGTTTAIIEMKRR